MTERNYTSTCSEALCGVLWGCSIGLLTFLDQWTKSLAKASLRGTEGISLIPSVLELSYLENRGMAFGLFQGKRLLFIVLCILFFAVLVYCYVRIPKNRYYFPLLAAGTILGAGALGNFIDRIVLGYVVDFIYISLIDFPVFNVADIFVVGGGIFLILLAGFYYKDEDFHFISRKKDRA